MNKAYRTAGRLFLKASPDEEGIDPETQAKIDAADIRTYFDAEELGDLNPYTSIFNTDTTFMFEGILTN